MATKLLANHQISPAIIDLIKAAKEHVVLITPYVKTWGHLESELKSATGRGVVVSLFFRKDQREKYTKTLEKLVSLGVYVFEVDLLHAKIYASEKEVIVSSMNLYDFSAKNSEEVAVYSDGDKLLTQIWDYMDELAENKATDITNSVYGKKVAKGIGKVLKAAATKVAAAVLPDGPGTCIRCKAEIEFDPAKPLCPKCFKLWNKYKDDKYQEKYCHDCGKSLKTSVAKPICYSCYKAGKA